MIFFYKLGARVDTVFQIFCHNVGEKYFDLTIFPGNKRGTKVHSDFQ